MKGTVGANDLEESILDYGWVNLDDDMVDEIEIPSGASVEERKEIEEKNKLLKDTKYIKEIKFTCPANVRII